MVHYFFQSNKLYGITSEGGARNNGSLFSINTTGSEFKVLYNFDSASGGSNPEHVDDIREQDLWNKWTWHQWIR